MCFQQAEDQAYIVNQDEGTVKLDQAYVEGAKLALAYTDIISAVDGVVVSRSVTGGQTVASSFQTPTLFLIAKHLRQLEVDTNTSEADMGGVKEGDKATFTVDAFLRRVFQGSVTQRRQSPQTVQNVVTYDVVIDVDNSDLALVPGMTASTTIIIDQRQDVLRLPNRALRHVPGGLLSIEAPGAGTPKSRQPQVWVLRDGGPVSVPIVPGLSDDPARRRPLMVCARVHAPARKKSLKNLGSESRTIGNAKAPALPFCVRANSADRGHCENGQAMRVPGGHSLHPCIGYLKDTVAKYRERLLGLGVEPEIIEREVADLTKGFFGDNADGTAKAAG